MADFTSPQPVQPLMALIQKTQASTVIVAVTVPHDKCLMLSPTCPPWGRTLVCLFPPDLAHITWLHSWATDTLLAPESLPVDPTAEVIKIESL